MAILIVLTVIMVSVGFTLNSFAAQDITITAAGDWGCTANTRQSVINTKAQNPNLVLALGDYSYADTANCWFDIISPIHSITKINIGNHEVTSISLLDSYLNNFGLSSQYYSYAIGNVHVITMSTEDAFEVGSQQYNFVVNDLEATSANSNIRWIIVNLHSPLYASPNTCGDSACSGDKNLRDVYHPLFDRYGVDLVLEGHVHNYQRSYPIWYNSQDSSSPLVTNCDRNLYNNPIGQIYTIVGTGGVNLHGLSGKASFTTSQQDSKFGILNMHFTDTKLDTKFVDNDGSIGDQFSISKTLKKNITESMQVPIQHCASSQTSNTSIQSKSDSSGSSKDQTSASSKDQTSTKSKINKIIPEIQKEIKQRTDKKLEEVKNRIEQKRQEIQQRLDTIKKDLQQEKNTKSSKK